MTHEEKKKSPMFYFYSCFFVSGFEVFWKRVYMRLRGTNHQRISESSRFYNASHEQQLENNKHPQNLKTIRRERKKE